MTTTLLDTINLNDALACGYTAPIDYTEGGLRIVGDAFPTLTLMGPDGSVELSGDAEIRELIRAAERVLLSACAEAA